MASIYAHYRMGMLLLPTMPGDIRRTVQRFRRLFDVGLHGPDIFLYYNPIFPTSVSELGSKFHEQTGRDFFQRVCRVARLEKSEAAQAYIYGALCHYALDSVFHSAAAELAAQEGISQGQLEVEFDRYLLEKDGKLPPESQNLSTHLQLTPGECATVAKFYPPVTQRQVQSSLRNMSAQVKLFAAPEGARRIALRKGMEVLKLPVGKMLMTTGPDPQCAHLDTQLMEKFNLAMEQFQELFTQIQAHLNYNGALGEEFSRIFG